MSFVVAPIVEGHGDVPAIRVLLQRIRPAWTVARPVRVPKNRLLQDAPLDKYVRIAGSNIAELGGSGAILIVIDADEDCAAELSASVGARAASSTKYSVECILPVREFETWLVAGDPANATEREPEQLADPKRVLKSWYGQYRETVDQPKLTGRADLERARVCRSFRALDSAIARLSSAEV